LSTGDGSLSHFNSAVDAATCAKRFQESIYDDKDLNVRVGVHLGDTIFEKGDIRCDGVNIASRLESMAVEGGVFVSKEVHDQLTNQKEFEGVSLGLQSLKGVGRLIEVYGLKGNKISEPNPNEYQDNKIDKHSDDEVPSIAIIPFDNKGQKEDAFYAYGISADLISDCSSAGLIRVAGLKETTYDDKDMNIRVGIHIGDIVFKDGDVFGGGVNVASRLESIAPAGGVCVSKSVYDELSNQDDFDGIELGLQSLKGVGRLIEVFGLKGDLLTEPKPSDYQDNKIDKHSDDEVPSIAIIPFDNKGADEDVFYAYGISADLITDCSSAGLIRVAGLNDIEKLDYRNLKYDELSKNLFVRYISTGTLWKMGDMFQLSIELYDTKDKKVVWSDRWQENWDNLPTIKSSLSDGLLKALDTKPKVEQKVGHTK
jgi:class 3 adenylate cyclase